jgi:hypothetical protein
MRGYDRQCRSKLAVYDLEIRVTEARGVDLDEEFVVFDVRDVHSHEFVWLVVLPLLLE